MYQVIGVALPVHKKVFLDVFSYYCISFEFCEIDKLNTFDIISIDKKSSKQLSEGNIKFINWDLIFDNLSESITAEDLRIRVEERLKVLLSIKRLNPSPLCAELHASIRVSDLAESARFYTWLFGVQPKEWTHRYVVFYRDDIKMNFVLLVADELNLIDNKLYHLGIGATSKEQVIGFYKSALVNSFTIEKLPRTTWRGTPLHELWLRDPDGTLIEIYSRLTDFELNDIPINKEPTHLV
jgi:catechol 2,3-dioxygenase-like lactoylglutathione lyase family enzyme